MNEGAVAGKQGLGELIRIRPYMQFMLSKMVSRFGDSIDSIAYSWMVYILTGSKVLMGTLLAVNFYRIFCLGCSPGHWWIDYLRKSHRHDEYRTRSDGWTYSTFIRPGAT